MLWSLNLVIRNTPIIHLSDSDSAPAYRQRASMHRGPYIRLSGNNNVQLNVDSTRSFSISSLNYGYVDVSPN